MYKRKLQELAATVAKLNKSASGVLVIVSADQYDQASQFDKNNSILIVEPGLKVDDHDDQRKNLISKKDLHWSGVPISDAAIEYLQNNYKICYCFASSNPTVDAVLTAIRANLKMSRHEAHIMADIVVTTEANSLTKTWTIMQELAGKIKWT